MERLTAMDQKFDAITQRVARLDTLINADDPSSLPKAVHELQQIIQELMSLQREEVRSSHSEIQH